jgi:hypothetical protein
MQSKNKTVSRWTEPTWMRGFQKNPLPISALAAWENKNLLENTREDPRVSKVFGTWCLTYEACPEGYAGPIHHIGLLTATDRGYETDTWLARDAPILRYGTQPGLDDFNVCCGVLVPRPDGAVWMYYHTYGGTNDSPRGYSCMAICPSGEFPGGFVKHPANPLWPLVGNEIHSYPDLIVPPEEAPDGRWHALASVTDDFFYWYVWHLTSPTGLPGTWSRVGAAPVLSPGSAPWMTVAPYMLGYGIYANGVWYLPVDGDNRGPPSGIVWSIGFLTTRDWVTFQIASSPSFGPDTDGPAWQSVGSVCGCPVYRPELSAVDIFYCGLGTSGRWKLGRARASNQLPPP